MTSIYVHIAIMAGLIVLQTVVFPNGLIGGAMPDLALIVLCFSSNHHGSFKGQLSGFVSGLVLDFLSLAPLGFHAFIRTVIGMLYGLFRGKVFIDPILVPVVLVILATFLKALIAFLISSVFAPELAAAVFSRQLGIEIGLNALVSPFLFALLKGIGMVRTGRSSGRSGSRDVRDSRNGVDR